jgi:hypothetical protein
LRSRDLHRRADWVEKDLPVLIDTTGHASLLRNLGIDVDALRSEIDHGVVGASAT